MTLSALRATGRWCEVRLLLLERDWITVQLSFALGGGATSAKSERIQASDLLRVGEVVERLAASVLESLTST